MKWMTPLLLAAAISAVHAQPNDASRIAAAQTKLQAIAADTPRMEIHASAFLPWDSAIDISGAAERAKGWDGIDLVGLRHESGTSRGGYLRGDMSMEDMMADYQSFMEGQEYRIIGFDLKGEAARLLQLSKDEGLMIEVGRKGFYAPAPSFTKPPPEETTGCDGMNCVSPFTPN